jgi:hypothetical protein
VKECGAEAPAELLAAATQLHDNCLLVRGPPHVL